MQFKQSRMKLKTPLRSIAIAALLYIGGLAGSARADIYLYTGSETDVILPAGTYIITAYGARGGAVGNSLIDGLGAEMSAEFDFSTPTTLTLLVGGVGGRAGSGSAYNGGGGGGGSFVVQGTTPLVVAGGGGGGAIGPGLLAIGGGNGTITTFGSAGGGNAGGSGGLGGGGGSGGDPSLTGVPNYGQGAGGGGGFVTDGTSGRPVIFYGLSEGEGTGGAALASALTTSMAIIQNGSGGLSFVDGGAGGLANLGGYFDTGFSNGVGGFGGGGGGYSGYFGFGGGGGGYSGGGGGGAFDSTTLPGGGGGGGSFIDSSAITILAEVSGSQSPDTLHNGEIIITPAPEPASASLLAVGALILLCRNRRSIAYKTLPTHTER